MVMSCETHAGAVRVSVHIWKETSAVDIAGVFRRKTGLGAARDGVEARDMKETRQVLLRRGLAHSL